MAHTPHSTIQARSRLRKRGAQGPSLFANRHCSQLPTMPPMPMAPPGRDAPTARPQGKWAIASPPLTTHRAIALPPSERGVVALRPGGVLRAGSLSASRPARSTPPVAFGASPLSEGAYGAHMPPIPLALSSSHPCSWKVSPGRDAPTARPLNVSQRCELGSRALNRRAPLAHRPASPPRSATALARPLRSLATLLALPRSRPGERRSPAYRARRKPRRSRRMSGSRL